jgi:hypothetical protein
MSADMLALLPPSLLHHINFLPASQFATSLHVSSHAPSDLPHSGKEAPQGYPNLLVR